ncbi:MOSC and FAD-binding oxidoreductase domain-containing protein [Mycobacterium montefiorense]|uniref:Sulfurase n=1 Tax=Mycobacterium montefiorense TaxID=154654 RepID=A0AA37V2B9_9MYCO|nr:MOSC and FAD-binding oxidoreductase domain-containing protein [Mycobacterium montefiorense]GBG36296.1 sulfurase [Mycobacterium montefiorense]GKU32935.1 sulfurase [Mycobacterium montefiorense]GKU38595.1 sulfurase [Mycobacterium montefiorense]GKU46638.1 sulfurase [Mycobacterium montefiorense]GKU51589.1 sulfurase [Mycobacterium montefiorense]
MGRLVSVNMGMPKNVRWRDKTVYTGIWKTPVEGPIMVRRLNIDGDGQGDLGGHGGEQRAVMVYQTESYDFWKAYLNRDDLQPGHFGENFTIAGLPDHDVCIGDRYRIGNAEFEVTQPRVTCFRVGVRLDEPEMPNLLVSQRRPGFYFRVITEGCVQAGDDIVRTRRGRHELSVADVDALLYLPDRNAEQLRKVVDVPALSPGWQQSFRDMLASQDGPAPTVGFEPGWNGFRPLRVSEIRRENPQVMSIGLQAEDGAALPPALPGQYLTVRIPGAGDPVPLRSYSLSSAASDYRISVKREDHGLVSRWLHAHIEPGSIVEAAAPRGDFYLIDDERPVVMISAGIGVTPVLAMLHALAATRSSRDIWWLHTTRDRETQAFAAEVTTLVESLPQARELVFYTQTQGRLGQPAIAALGLPTDAAAYLCGPTQFMTDMREALVAAGLDGAHIHSELFGALPPINPGIVDGAARKPPHVPPGPPGTGPSITFARSGLTVQWSSDYGSILDFAEACDVPTRFSCRSGVCHVCETGVVAGVTSYVQPPLEAPGPGSVLICSAAPDTDLVLDL